MGLKDELEQAGGHFKDALEDVAHAGEKAADKLKHGADEMLHRNAADQARKDQEDPSLPESERAKSGLDAAKEDIQANVSGVKQKLDDF